MSHKNTQREPLFYESKCGKIHIISNVGAQRKCFLTNGNKTQHQHHQQQQQTFQINLGLTHIK